jgi:hypothetical protein
MKWWNLVRFMVQQTLHEENIDKIRYNFRYSNTVVELSFPDFHIYAHFAFELACFLLCVFRDLLL